MADLRWQNQIQDPALERLGIDYENHPEDAEDRQAFAANLYVQSPRP